MSPFVSSFILCLIRKWPSVSYACLVFCSLTLVTLYSIDHWRLWHTTHNISWFTQYLSDLIWVVWGWGWRHSCHSSTSRKSFPRMVVRGLQGKGKFCHYHNNGQQTHFLFLKLHSSGTLNINLWWQIMSECKRRESPDFRFPEVGISDGGNMTVDVTAKSKNDRLPKPQCLGMLLQNSFFRLKKLIKVKKGLTT